MLDPGPVRRAAARLRTKQHDVRRGIGERYHVATCRQKYAAPHRLLGDQLRGPDLDHVPDRIATVDAILHDASQTLGGGGGREDDLLGPDEHFNRFAVARVGRRDVLEQTFLDPTDAMPFVCATTPPNTKLLSPMKRATNWFPGR